MARSKKCGCRMSIEPFIRALVEADARGLTRDEFAKVIGIRSASVYQRCNELRRLGVKVPVLKTRGRRTLVERANEALRLARRTVKA